MVDLSALLASADAQIKANETEALLILTAHIGQAERIIKGAIAENDGINPGPIDLDTGGVKFARPEARAILQKGKREATRLLFNSYATVVFPQAPDACTFVSVLGEIAERVATKLEGGIDQTEAELCRLEWVKRAWEQARPEAASPLRGAPRQPAGRSAVLSVLKRLQAFLTQSSPKTTDEREERNLLNEDLPHATAGASTAPPSAGEAVPTTERRPIVKAGAVEDETERTDLAAMVDEFLQRCNLEPDLSEKIIRKHISLAVGHTAPRQFQYWQKRSDKATDEDDRNFRRILGMKPADFIALLKKRHII